MVNKANIRLSYCGDLILLKDQVDDGYVPGGGGYDFDQALANVKGSLGQSDLSIGVCEGPFAGEAAGYSNTNLHDGKKISLNFPDEFAVAIAKAGINLVTISNNHILDKGVEGALRTREVLTSAGIRSFGFFADDREYNQVKVFDVKGLKVAVLSYTYGCNYRESEELFDERHVKVLLPKHHARLAEAQKVVLDDIQRARQQGADFIIVLPHIGTEFVHFPDSQQRFWCKFFVKHGADLVLGAHSHNTQPIVWYGKSVVVYSPGNLINSFTERDVDAGMIVTVDVDAGRKRIARVAYSPTICHRVGGSFVADLVLNLRSSFDKRAEEVSRLVTKSVGGRAVSLSDAKESYRVTRHRLWRIGDVIVKLRRAGRAKLSSMRLNFLDRSY